ncbi:hypothetical protein ACHQM5_013355 [Ranunculus cassubicifolius]
MPIISEAASALRSRFGFHKPSDSSDAAPCTPSIPKSASRESLFQSSAINFDTETTYERSIQRSVSTRSFDLEEDPSFWKDHNVQVIIRIRPLSNSEISTQGHNKCVRQDSSQTLTWTGHPETRFTFDQIADENVTQENLFKVAGLPMVENCMGGYNSCMFAYGQTGSGKTHTMLGDIEEGTRRHSVNCGMTPRVFEHLFTRIQKEKEARKEEKLKFTCKCSFLEIYNEQILDLLDPNSSNLQIREDAKKGVYVENLTELEVVNARDVMQQLIQGSSNRKVAATNMNRASSRSHSVFTCIIESKWESQGVTHHRFARLNLVDLAGSERQKSSGAEGERLKEATNINKSLSTLGLVIMNLVSLSNGKSLHVPYRDSKLTFLLQDSLGGNSKTTIIANISPSMSCSLETMSTLKFAQRAKFIKNNAIVNEDASGDVLTMRIEIQQLKKEIIRLQGLADGGTEYKERDTGISFPGSPGSFKWEALQGFSPLTSDRRISQKKEFEAALIGAFKREREKDIALQALAAENLATTHLAKKREDEIQGLKMRLRFREAGIKRLEAVASGKMSAETHLLQEKEEYLKEIESLQSQVERNHEVTRFAMENLQLKEEIRRLKSFYEEGERERMNEQISILENKLLEALDWKLMHESEYVNIENKNSDLADLEDSLLTSSKEQRTSTWQSNLKEENEFLRMQAIQNQSEMETLRRKLNACLEEREQLERRVGGLVTELEEEKRSTRNLRETMKQLEVPDLPRDTTSTSDDHSELETMVDAIAAVSQREAEAHEIAITLGKENEDLRIKLKASVEDKQKLIELYEKNQNGNTELSEQLQDLHEENDKLLGLYETAMQERDEFKRRMVMFSCGTSKLDCLPDKLGQVADSLKLVREIEIVEEGILEKKQVISELKTFSSQLDDRKCVVENQLSALKTSTSKMSDSILYWEERESRSRARVESLNCFLDEKKESLNSLQSRILENEMKIRKGEEKELELRDHIVGLNSKFERKALFTIENFEVKATDLLRAEEEKTRLKSEMKDYKQKLSVVLKDIEDLKRNLKELDGEKQSIGVEIKNGGEKTKELENAYHEVVKEKEVIKEMVGKGREEIQKFVGEYCGCVFECDLKEGEIDILEGELVRESGNLEELKKKMRGVMEVEKVVEEVRASVLEAKSLLVDDNGR